MSAEPINDRRLFGWREKVRLAAAGERIFITSEDLEGFIARIDKAEAPPTAEDVAVRLEEARRVVERFRNETLGEAISAVLGVEPYDGLVAIQRLKTS